MTKNRQDQFERAYRMLLSLQSKIGQMTAPVLEIYVHEYREALDNLKAIGIDTSRFNIPDSKLKHRDTAISIYQGGERISPYKPSEEKYVDKTYFLAQLDVFIDHLESIKPEKLKIQKVPNQTSSKKVFVVYGRNDRLRESMFNFLRALGLNPVEWSQAIQATQKSSPYIGEILETAFGQAQAIIVIFSVDDEARLREEFWRQNEPSYEKELTPQPRPNVIFEAGMAMGKNENRTILVQVGKLRPISDIAGRHITHLDDSSQKRQELVAKLRGAGCEVDTSGTDWLSVGEFQ